MQNKLSKVTPAGETQTSQRLRQNYWNAKDVYLKASIWVDKCQENFLADEYSKLQFIYAKEKMEKARINVDNAYDVWQDLKHPLS